MAIANHGLVVYAPDAPSPLTREDLDILMGRFARGEVIVLPWNLTLRYDSGDPLPCWNAYAPSWEVRYVYQ